MAKGATIVVDEGLYQLALTPKEHGPALAGVGVVSDPLAEGRNWLLDALCTEADSGIFYDDAARNLAKAWCSLCPVAAQCLRDALVEEDGQSYRYGVRGGTTPEERKEMARGQGRPGVSA